jgi:hypothetical protein
MTEGGEIRHAEGAPATEESLIDLKRFLAALGMMRRLRGMARGARVVLFR